MMGAIAWMGPIQPAGATPQTLDGLKLELVSETSAIQPGVPFTVGLRIDHAPGRHTYWKNPGIVGVPTKLEWTLPAGFVAGEIEWPQPQLTTMAIYPVYGYKGETLLPVTITPPASLDQAEVTLQAAASWMCCGKTCHPGFATLSLTLPIAGKDESPEPTAAQPLFIQARKNRPERSDAWKITATLGEGTITAEIVPATGSSANLALLKDSAAAGVYFFSSDGLIDSRPEQQIVELPGSSGLRLKLTISEHAPALPTEGARLSGVLAAKIPWIPGTSATAIEIDVPIQR